MRPILTAIFGLALSCGAGAEDLPVLVESAAVASAPLSLSDKAWDKVPKLEIKLQKQNFVPPMGGGAVAALTVQSLHGGGNISFRLSWKDATKNDTIDISDRFVDACALQFPLKEEEQATFMMGHQGARVNIWRWKALKQEGERYPKNYADDFYREGALPNKYPGHSGPFEQLVAEGFGTLTRCKEQDLQGAAEWKNGEWSVLISRSLISKEGSTLASGKEMKIAFAVWDGQQKERNGMKSLTQWLRLLLKNQGAP